MAVMDVYNLKGEKTSQMELPEEIYNSPIKKHVLHQVVVSQLHNQRSGSASAKNRAEVKGSGRKLSRQKGTGNARAGRASSPLRRGGGAIFGPIPGKTLRKVPKKMKKSALCMALTDKVKSQRLVVVNDFNLDEIKTKTFVKVMDIFEVHKALIVTEHNNENLEKSSKNVPGVKVMRYEGLNVYDILNYDHLFMVQSVMNKVEEALIS